MRIYIKSICLFISAVVMFSLFAAAAVTAGTKDGSVCVKAENVSVEKDRKTVPVRIYLTDIPNTGCCACKFRVSVDHDAVVSGYELSSLNGNQIAQISDDKKSVSFIWIGGISSVVYAETVILTVNVSLPKNAEPGSSVNIMISPEKKEDFFLDKNEDNLKPRSVDGSVSVILSADSALKLSASNVTESAGSGSVLVDVILSNVKEYGASSCLFAIEVPGAKVVDCREIGLKGNVSFEKYGDGMKFVWIGGTSNSVFSDALVGRFTVKLPADLDAEKTLDVILTPDPDPENFLAADGVTALGCFAENGSVEIVYSDAVVIESPILEVAGSDGSFTVDVWVRNVGDLGLCSAKFNISVENAVPVGAESINVEGNVYSEIKDGLFSLVWVGGPDNAIYEDFLIASVSFRFAGKVNAGDNLKIDVQVAKDRDFYLPGEDSEDPIGRGACAVCGVVKVVGHTLEHFGYLKPTPENNGHIEYWYCSHCGKCFIDSDAGVEISPERVVLILGDASGDGKLNAKDVTLLMKALTGMKTVDLDFVDFNGDGKFNAKDVIAMMKYLTRSK